MKNLGCFFIYATTLLVACNNTAERAETSTLKKDSVVNGSAAPFSVCYASNGRDTVRLQLKVVEKTVSGSLLYKLSEKDSNSGNFEGELKGDTLLADYNFMSEGQKSVRQVIFLLQDNIAVEGYGDMEDQNGKMVFKNIKAVTFGKGIKLQKVACNN